MLLKRLLPDKFLLMSKLLDRQEMLLLSELLTSGLFHKRLPKLLLLTEL